MGEHTNKMTVADVLQGSRLYALPGQYVCDVPEILNEHAKLLTRLTTAERERDEAVREREALREEMQHDDTIINGQAALLTGVANVLHGEPEPLTMHSHHDLPELVLALRQRAERMERVVEAAKAYEKWMGKWHDYTKTTGDVPHKVEAALINAVRAAVAAKTTTNTEDTIV